MGIILPDPTADRHPEPADPGPDQDLMYFTKLNNTFLKKISKECPKY